VITIERAWKGNKVSKSEQPMIYMNVSLIDSLSSNRLFEHIIVPSFPSQSNRSRAKVRKSSLILNSCSKLK
jgi:hypothetical protein